MFVDIKKGFRQYSEKELLEYSSRGVLVCGDYELDDFISYLMTGINEIIDERIQQAREEWQNIWDDGQ